MKKSLILVLFGVCLGLASMESHAAIGCLPGDCCEGGRPCSGGQNSGNPPPTCTLPEDGGVYCQNLRGQIIGWNFQPDGYVIQVDSLAGAPNPNEYYRVVGKVDSEFDIGVFRASDDQILQRIGRYAWIDTQVNGRYVRRLKIGSQVYTPEACAGGR